MKAAPSAATPAASIPRSKALSGDGAAAIDEPRGRSRQTTTATGAPGEARGRGRAQADLERARQRAHAHAGGRRKAVPAASTPGAARAAKQRAPSRRCARARDARDVCVRAREDLEKRAEPVAATGRRAMDRTSASPRTRRSTARAPRRGARRRSRPARGHAHARVLSARGGAAKDRAHVPDALRTRRRARRARTRARGPRARRRARAPSSGRRRRRGGRRHRWRRAARRVERRARVLRREVIGGAALLGQHARANRQRPLGAGHRTREGLVGEQLLPSGAWPHSTSAGQVVVRHALSAPVALLNSHCHPAHAPVVACAAKASSSGVAPRAVSVRSLGTVSGARKATIVTPRVAWCWALLTQAERGCGKVDPLSRAEIGNRARIKRPRTTRASPRHHRRSKLTDFVSSTPSPMPSRCAGARVPFAPWFGEYLARGAEPAAREPLLRTRLALDATDAAAHHELGLILLNARGDTARAPAKTSPRRPRTTGAAAAHADARTSSRASSTSPTGSTRRSTCSRRRSRCCRPAAAARSCATGTSRRSRAARARPRAASRAPRSAPRRTATSASARGAARARSTRRAWRRAVELYEEPSRTRARPPRPPRPDAARRRRRRRRGRRRGRVRAADEHRALLDARRRRRAARGGGRRARARERAAARARRRPPRRGARLPDARGQSVRDDALALDARCVKALYRRAAARERRSGVGDLHAVGGPRARRRARRRRGR